MSEHVSFTSYSMKNDAKAGRTWFDWCVFVDPHSPALPRIKSVEYLLHPTFPDPRRTATDPSDCFALFSAGWGEFQVNIRIEFTDGTVGNQPFCLHLVEGGWPKAKDPEALPNNGEKVVYAALKDSSFRWRKFHTITNKCGLPPKQVKNILDHFHQQNLARKAFFLSVDGQELWGATSVVGLAPCPQP